MVIGVDLGGTKVRAGLADHGRILSVKQQLFKSRGSQDETLGQLKDLIRSLMRPEVTGIGLGVPSVIDLEHGIVYNVMNIPSWERVPLKEIIEDEFNLPAAINNDVNCFALGEHRFGLVKDFDNVVAMASGTGLGCGVILCGELFSGTNCGAGEIGLVQYGAHNVEYYASGNFFEAVHGLTAIDAHDMAIRGDEKALHMWKEFGVHMGQAIKTVLYAYDPQAIVIGGSLSKAYRFFHDSMMASLESFTYPQTIKRLKIFQSVDQNITLLGAAALLSHKEKSAAEVKGEGRW